jgi:hypothetical protein
MRLLHQYDVIPAETLRKLAEEIGVGWPKLVRLTFFVMLVFLAVYLVVTVVYLLTDVVFESAGLAAGAKRLALLIPPLAGLLIIWFVSARVRFKRIRNIILKYLRCPHCGYDIRGLPTASEDGATICPECGCAWRLDDTQTDESHRSAVPGRSRTVGSYKGKDNGSG